MTEHTLPFYGDGKPVNGIDVIDIQSRQIETNGTTYQWTEAYLPKNTAARTKGIGGKLLTIIEVDDERKAAISSSSFGIIQPVILSDGALTANVDDKIEGFTSDLMPALQSSDGILYDVDPIVFTRSNTHAGFYFLGQATYQSESWLRLSLRDFHEISSRSVVASDSGALPSLTTIVQGTEPKVFEYATAVPLYEDEALEASLTVSFSSKRQKFVTKLAPKDPKKIPDGDDLVGYVDFGNLVKDPVTGALKFDEMSWSVKSLDSPSRQLIGLVMTSCSAIEQIPIKTSTGADVQKRAIDAGERIIQGLAPKQPRPFN